jgi:excinuclease ABC subunit B
VPHSFHLKAPFAPAGDQPQAIKKLVAGLDKKLPYQTLLGVTGSGKTYTMASVIAETQKPALVMSHNKTLAAQLAGEFKEFFPDNAVEYFVSYYDYYQPEAYVPRTDTYIAKDASINDQIDRLRHAAMEAVLTRKDVVVVASVSCIYGIGSPTLYLESRLEVTPGQNIKRDELLRHLTRLQYTRNDIDVMRGTYRARGDIVDIYPASGESLIRVEFLGPKVDALVELDALTGEVLSQPAKVLIFPATFFMTESGQMKGALASIRAELAERVTWFKEQGKELEAQRIAQRATYDLEMMEQLGYVSGIENYSRHMDGRLPGQPPFTLVDYFVHSFGRDGFITFIDESHMSVPQIRGMHAGDAARKDVLITHGFRLPSAKDNRPLRFDEFSDRIGPTIFASATPEEYEYRVSGQVVEQIIRPTGLLDPEIDIRPTQHQVDDVMDEILQRVRRGERVLVTTLTKRLAEELSSYLIENGTKAAYLHSDIDTIERWEILSNLRRGTYDVLVGINLLREGLDLPEVSLVAILDADKEGYLRSASALIQIMGRAARHLNGQVIMYADKVTGSMQRAIDETNRRRALQEAFNKKYKMTPRSITKEIYTHHLTRHEQVEEKNLEHIVTLTVQDQRRALKELSSRMELAARNLEFERAAELRDMIQKIRTMLKQNK